MKILCVIDSLGSGGAQRQLVNLAIGFKEKGHNVSLLVYHKEDFFRRILDEADINVNEIIEASYFKRLLKMRKFIRKNNFDGILSFLEASNFICEISSLPKREWNLVVGERSANPKIYKSAKLRIYRWFHFLASSIVSNSYANLKILEKVNFLLNKRKLKVIYNIVDRNLWKPLSNFSFRQNGKINLIIAASHQEIKNLNGLIEAVHLLSEDEKNQLKIDWYGDERSDNSKTTALEKIEKLNLKHIFNFHNPSLQLYDSVQNADAVGLFSFYEGLPNSICEAMSCAKPVIVSNISDLPNIVYDPMLVCNPNDPISIKESLSYLISLSNDKLQLIGNSNKINADRLFNSEFIVNSYLELLRR